jgi:hypothetical protein
MGRAGLGEARDDDAGPQQHRVGCPANCSLSSDPEQPLTLLPTILGNPTLEGPSRWGYISVEKPLKIA